MANNGITHVTIPVELFQLPLRGCYELAIAGLVYAFKENGLTMSNRKLASALGAHTRTIERAISRLIRAGIIENTGKGNYDRCLVFRPDMMPVVSTDMTSVVDPPKYRHDAAKVPTSRVKTTDMTADHNKEVKVEEKVAPAPGPPNLDDVQVYADSINHPGSAEKFWQWYDASDWRRKNGKPVLNWKQTFQSWVNREKPNGKPVESDHPGPSEDEILASFEGIST